MLDKIVDKLKCIWLATLIVMGLYVFVGGLWVKENCGVDYKTNTVKECFDNGN